MDLRDLPDHPLRALRHRLLLPHAPGRRYGRHGGQAAREPGGIRPGAAPAAGDAAGPVRPQLRLLDHGEPGGAPLRPRTRHQRAPDLASAPRSRALRIDDAQLADRIAAEPAFQEDGKFSKARYEAIARSQGLTVVGLDERLREDMRLAPLPRRHRPDDLHPALDPRRVHPPVGAEPRGEPGERGPRGLPRGGEADGGRPQGVLRGARQGVPGARAGPRGVRRALAGRAGRAHARRSGGREEVLRVQQVSASCSARSAGRATSCSR